MKLVSIKIPITNVIDIIGDEILNIEPTLIKWAIKADQNIGSYYSYEKKNIVLEVIDCKTQIPCGAVIIKYVLLGDYGCDCDLFNKNLVIQNTIYDISQGDVITNYAYRWSSGSNLIFSNVSWSLQGNDIVFPYNYNGKSITVNYMAYKTDINGYPLIRDTHIEAIAKYIELKLLEKERWKLLKLGKMHNAFVSIYNDTTIQYHRKVRHARAEDGEINDMQRHEIAELINNPLSGYTNYMLENLH